jgi:predicted flap endonuclease-1-like 5' DNA nuclease
VAPGRPAAQDLTRIRAIDEQQQKQLNALGVGTYADIAAWRPEDVARIGAALKIPGRIEQENWIEQAQILAKGGETYYSRRKAMGELPTSRPTPDEGERITVRVPAATRVADIEVIPPVTPPAGAGADLKATAAAAAAAVHAAQATVSPATATPAAAPAPMRVAPAVVPATQPEPAATRPVGIGRDNLQRIAGINAEVERLLHVQGVTRYAHIAGWSSTDTARFDRLLGFEGRVARENWIEQAKILSAGGETAYSREMARQAVESAQPARLADAIQARSETTAPREDLSALRSVRSEAYRGADTGGAAASGRAPDDLKRIRGVGVLIEKKLNALGVTRYEQVANWSAADIERFSDKLDFKGRIERENWVEQARILSAGGQTEFSQRVDRGEVETSTLKV